MPDSHPSAPHAAGPLAGPRAELARRYAGALFTLAERERAVDAVAADLQALGKLWDESAAWRFVATDPRLTPAALARAAAQVAQSGLGAITAKFIGVLAANRRLALLPAITAEFFALQAAARGERRATICTATALTPPQREALTRALAAIAGGQIALDVTEDAGLIGGLTVKMGSRFIDASVRSRLDRMERSLKTNAA